VSDPVLIAIITGCAAVIGAIVTAVWNNTGQRKQKKRETSEKVIDQALRLGVAQYVALVPLPIDKPTLAKSTSDAILPLLVAHLDCEVSVIRERLKALRATMLQPSDEFVVAMLPALIWFNAWCKAQIPTLLEMRRQMGFRWLRSDQAELLREWDVHFGFIDKWLRDHTERLIDAGLLSAPTPKPPP